MARKTMDFGPRSEREELTFAAEGFRIDVQHELYRVMQEKRVSQKELARRLGVTEARVSQVFADNCNVTLRTLGKIFHALGVEGHLTTGQQREWWENPRGGASWTAPNPNTDTATAQRSYPKRRLPVGSEYKAA
jgi:transcriptional regulator with XRE-family HTH domain